MKEPVKEKDLLSILEAASSMTKIAENVEEYGKVTEEHGFFTVEVDSMEHLKVKNLHEN